jgi:hypothetical protein
MLSPYVLAELPRLDVAALIDPHLAFPTTPPLALLIGSLQAQPWHRNKVIGSLNFVPETGPFNY